MPPSHEPVIDVATVNWEFDPGPCLPINAVYIAAAIPRPDNPPEQQPGIVGPQHRVGLTVDRMVDLLASSLQDRYLRPQRERLLGILGTAPTGSSDEDAATKQLLAMERLEFPWPIYASIVPGIAADGAPVIGIIVFYTEKGGGNGNGNGAPSN